MKRLLVQLLITGFIASSLCAVHGAEPSELADLVELAREKRIGTTKCSVVIVDRIDREVIEFRADSAKGYPGIAIQAPNGTWDLSAYGQIEAEIANTGAAEVTVALRVDNAGDWRTSPWSVVQMAFAPGEKKVITTPFGKLYGESNPRFDPAKVVGVNIFAARGKGEAKVQVLSLRAAGAPAPVSAAVGAGPEKASKPRVLIDFGPDFDVVTQVRPDGSKVALANVDGTRVLSVELGTTSGYPGVRLQPPELAWDLSAYTGIEIDVTNTSKHTFRIHVRVDNKGANGRSNCNCEAMTVQAGATRTIPVTFGRSWGEPAFPLDSSKVLAVLVFTDRQREPASFTIRQLRAFAGDKAPAAPAAKPEPKVTWVSAETYPVALNFEPPHTLFDLHGGEMSAREEDVITGMNSLVGDSFTNDITWFEFFTTRPGLIKPGFEYTATFRYRVLRADPKAKLYALMRSMRQGWGKWDRGWTNMPELVAAPAEVREGTLTVGLDVQDDYQLMFGLNGNARVAIDEIRITRGKPYKQPDRESERIKAIPDAAAVHYAFGFETEDKQLHIGRGTLVTAREQVISGSKSLLIDSLDKTGEWHGMASTRSKVITGGYRYHVYLTSRALQWGKDKAYAYIVVKRTGSRIKPADIAWKRWRGPIGKDAKAYMHFEVPEGENASMQLGLSWAGKVLVDDWVVRREPLGVSGIAHRKPVARTDANLVWSDEFDGTQLDAAKWNISNEPRRGGWWAADDAFLDGEGHLVLRFRKRKQGYTMGAINSEGKFEFTYGYVEARMQLPKSAGHWPGIWLFSGQVTKIGNDGRDGTEVDIVECPWRNRDTVSHALHWDGYGLDHQSTGRHADIPGVHEGWHTFAVDWSPAGYIFFVDGVETWRTSAGGVCRNPLHVILSDEMGGWSGNPDKATSLPDRALIDYVRIWQE